MLLLVGCMLVFFLVAVIVWVPSINANDPVYQGRRLSSWLQAYPHTPPQAVEKPLQGMNPMSSQEIQLFYDRHFGKDVAQAHRALLGVGGDALPLLVQMLGVPEKRLDRWRSRVRSVIERYVPIRDSGYHVQREQAITALLDLNRDGCELGPIMPEIEKLAKDADSEISSAASFLMERLARDGKTAGSTESAK